jgi:hypothetical protein
MDRSFHIPIVCGVLIPDDTDAAVDESCPATTSVPYTIEFEALQHRFRNEPAPSDMDARPERAPPTSDSSFSRKSSRNSHSSLSQQERRYWIRVIVGRGCCDRQHVARVGRCRWWRVQYRGLPLFHELALPHRHHSSEYYGFVSRGQ